VEECQNEEWKARVRVRGEKARVRVRVRVRDVGGIEDLSQTMIIESSPP